RSGSSWLVSFGDGLLGCIKLLAGISQGSKMTHMSRKPVGRAAQARDGARERILAAALQVFAEQGFDGARTREIAERADANLGLIKYYFDGKEQLWKAAVTRAFAELQADL